MCVLHLFTCTRAYMDSLACWYGQPLNLPCNECCIFLCMSEGQGACLCAVSLFSHYEICNEVLLCIACAVQTNGLLAATYMDYRWSRRSRVPDRSPTMSSVNAANVVSLPCCPPHVDRRQQAPDRDACAPIKGDVVYGCVYPRASCPATSCEPCLPTSSTTFLFVEGAN